MKESYNQPLSQKVKPQVLECGPGQHWDVVLKKCVPDCPTGYVNDPVTGACVIEGGGPTFYVTYAGVQIGYYASNHLLSFSNVTDVNTVIDQLDADYENYNTTYDNQYPYATALELDSLDSVNNFNEFATYENFEGSFSMYSSKRKVIYQNETIWLSNNMVGTDPDSLDYTLDNSINAICNSNYQLIIGGTKYQWTENGLVVAGGTIAAGIYSPQGKNQCFSNYRGIGSPWFFNADTTRKCKLKVAVNACIIRGEAKAKVKSFRKKNNQRWIRSRIDLRVRVQCPLQFFATCEFSKNVDKSKPTQGFYKRKELKVIERVPSSQAYMYLGTIWGYYYTNISGFSGQRNI